MNAVGFKQVLLQQWNQRQQDARWITSRTGHQLRFPERLAVNLHQAVNAALRQGRLPQGCAVKILIHRKILDPEIRAQINDAQPRAQERPGKLMSQPVRQRQKRHFSARSHNGVHIGVDELQIRVAHPLKTRKNAPHALACQLARSQGNQLRAGMPDEYPDQLLTRITTRSNNCDFNQSIHAI